MGRAFEYRRAAKEKRWGKMSRVFPKLGRAITLAAKEGGPDPEMNAKLRLCIQIAKSQNMPKDNIDAAIKRASGKEVETMTEVNYEGKGPHGVLIFVECATDNNTRTVANVKSYFNKFGGSMAPSGSLDFMFNRKAVFEFTKTESTNLDELELELIDAGMEEMEEHEGTVYVQGDYTAYGALSAKMQELELDITKAELQRVPTTPVEFSEEQLEEIEKFIDRLEDDDDVQSVFTNIA
jgi:YebC/PmpR family DNA-binding regulatory protein